MKKCMSLKDQKSKKANLLYYLNKLKQIRELNRMIRALAKGRVPKPASAPARLAIAMMIVNEEANALKLKKREDEIVEYPIETVVPEVNELLEELAAITGLGAVEIEAFKADLARMRASERPGFLKEVMRTASITLIM